MSYIDDFLRKIKPGAYHNWKQYKVLPSITAAQSALESNWGRSQAAIKANNLFGVKGAYKGQSVVMPTQEWVGGWVTINAAFAKYPSWNVSVDLYGQLIGQTKTYKSAIGKTDPSDQIMAIWSSGYATDPSYPGKIMSIVNANNLRAWDLDAFAGGDGGNFDIDASDSGGGGDDGYKNFSEDLIKKNSTTRPGFKLEGIQAIVLHDIQSNANLNSVKNVLNSGNSGQKMGYHVIVTDNDAKQVVPFNEGVYHAERGPIQIQGMKSPNKKTLSIGIVTKKSLSQFSTVLNVRLALVVAEICRTYKIPASAVIPAWQVDGITEPVSWYNNPFLYTAFTGMVSDAIEKGEEVITNPDYKKEDSTSGNVGTGGMLPSGKGVIRDIIAEAYDLLRTMTYSWAKPPQIRKGGFGDCSSFCQYLYKKHANFDIGSYTDAQWYGDWGKRVPISDARPGDLIFFSGTYNTNFTTSHIGVVVEKGKMIDFGVTPGPQLHDYNDAIWGPHLYGVKRLFSDAEYNQSQSHDNQSSKPTIDSKGSYVVNVKRSTIATDADVNGVSQCRLSPNEVYRVETVGKNSLKLASNDLWVSKSNEDITLSRLAAPDTPIGTITTKLPTKVYVDPTYVAEPAMEKGSPKTIPQNTSMNIYAVENGFAQIDLEQNLWAVANSTYNSLMIDLVEESPEQINFEQGVPINTTVRGRLEDESYTTPEDGLVVQNGLGIVAHVDLLPIGAVVNITIPSAPKYNRRAVVVSNQLNDSDGNVLELIFHNEGEQYRFGGRKAIVTLEDILKTQTDIVDFMEHPSEYVLPFEQAKAEKEGMFDESI